MAKSKKSSSTSPAAAHAQAERKLRRFAMDAARLLDDLHCTDVLVLDVRDQSPNTDYVILATGTSDRQIRSVGLAVEELGRTRGLRRFGQETDARASWVLVDFSDVVVHIFEAFTRAHYDLEMMWGDVPRIRWRPVRKTPPSARRDDAP